MDFVKKNINKIITGIVVLIIVTFIYQHFFKTTENDFAESEEVVVEDSEISEISKEILRTLDKLGKIKIDTDFFAEDLSQSGNLVSFYELIDFSKTNIAPKKIGKQNPFSANSEFYIKIYGDYQNDSINNNDQEGNAQN